MDHKELSGKVLGRMYTVNFWAVGSAFREVFNLLAFKGFAFFSLIALFSIFNKKKHVKHDARYLTHITSFYF